MLDFREHKKRPDRLTDVLPWAALVAPEVILNKDGSFQATISYRGPDLDSSTPEELTVKASQVNNILRRFGSNWALYAEAKREVSDEYPDSKFPDLLSALIDEERKQRLTTVVHYESRYYLTLIYLPPAETTTKVTSLFLSSSDKASVSYERQLEHFRSEVERTASSLSRVFPEVEPLSNEELLTYLHSTISLKSHRVALPEVPMYIDSLLADTPLLGGFDPKLGTHHLAVISILSFPSASQPGILDALNDLALPYRWITRFMFLDKLQAKKELEGYQRKWFAKRKGLSALIKELVTKEESAATDTDALLKAQDAQLALEELGTDELSYGFFTNVIILSSEDEATLRDEIKEVERIINSAGFTTKKENVNAVDAWLGSVPGNTQRNIRRPLISTINLTHLLPGVSALWSGQKSNQHLKDAPLFIAQTSGTTPFRYVHHIGDVGHTLILGPTGSGKSTLLNFIALQFLRYADSQVYIFDKGNSALSLTAGLGGDYYDLGSEDSNLFFQPLSRVDEPSEMKWAHDWLVAIAEKENVTVTPEIKKSIWDALSSVAATPREQRTLHSFTVYLQNKELRSAFLPYTQNGAYGRLIDNNKDNLELSSFQCFEMERLMEMPSVVGPVLAYLFHRLEQRFNGSPTLLILDEAWLFLDHPIFATKIREWLKTLRKQNVSVIFATQSLADVDNSPIAATIREACFTKIYLPNSVALQPDAADFYKRFGLNERQTEILAYSYAKQDYYYTSPLGNRLFQLGLDELTLAYCAGASKERTTLVKALLNKSVSLAEYNEQYLLAKRLPHFAALFTEALEVEKRAA